MTMAERLLTALRLLQEHQQEGWHRGTGYRDWESLTNPELTCAKVLARADDRDDDEVECTCGLNAALSDPDNLTLLGQSDATATQRARHAMRRTVEE